MSDSAITKSPKKPVSGLPVVFAAIAIQLTLGIAYLWSIFQTGIANAIFSGDNAQSGLTFSLLLATLTIGSVIGGKLVTKLSTKKVVLLGGIILSAGFFLASFVTAEFSWALWLTYGVMGGTGMGFTYSTTIACAQKWYPHKKGLITGIIVSALGFGGVIFTPIIRELVEHFGDENENGVVVGGEQPTFMVLAGIFLIVCTIGSFFLKSPHGNDVPPAPASECNVSKSPSQMLRDPKFYVLTLAFTLACLGGLTIINYARPIAEMKGLVEQAFVGLIAISLFNSVGRLVWGMISDKLGRINTIFILLVGSAVLSLFIQSVQGVLVFVLIGGIGLFYGGLLSTFPSLTADIFGAKHLATNYGFVLLGFGTGAIAASQIGGHFRNLAVLAENDIAKMTPAFIIGSCCAAGSILLMIVLKLMTKKTSK
jgi:OFA family oxalate/formate antiporter-like MFS transporter